LILAGGLVFLASSGTEEKPESAFNTTDIKMHQLAKTLPTSVQKKEGFSNLVSTQPSETVTEKLNAAQSKELLKESYQSLVDCYQTGCGQGPDKDGFYDSSLTVSTITLKRVLEVTVASFEKSSAREWLNEEQLLSLLESDNKELRKAALANLLKLKGETAFEAILEKSRDLEGYGAGDIIEDLLSHLDESNREKFFGTLELIYKEKDSFTILETLERIESIQVSLPRLKQVSEGLCRFINKPAEAMNVKAMNHYLSSWAQNSGNSFSLNNHCL